MLWVLLLAALIALNGWLRTGCLVPYLLEREPEYLLLLPSPLWLAVWFVASVAILRVMRRSVRNLTPIVLLTLPLVAVALLATPLRRAAGPWLYLAVDMFWWLVAAVVVLIALEWRPSLSIPSRWRWSFDAALAVVLVASSLLASPRLRFQSVLVGDEPKYLRYLENWYRGHGMDVSSLGPIADLPPGEGSHVSGNVARLGRALADESRDLTAGASPGRASSQGGWFVDGKRGGVYQVHNPGISFLLFPGYLIDRAVSDTQMWHPQFPTNLYGTGALVLLLYILWGLAVFRLLRSHTQHATVSWIVAATLFLSLPVAAFAYQYYPEVAAGLFVAWLVRYTALSADGRRLAAAGHGLLAGFLPWLHLRFAPLTVLAVVVFALTRRRDRSALASFAGGLLLPLAALALYDYHVTGSVMPWSLYALMPDAELFSPARAWRDFPAMWLDRTWGLVGHAPIYLFALPGFWPLWRKSPRATIVVVLSILAMAVPAAGHGYTGAFTTPSRLIAAVLPLLALPIVETAMAYASSQAFTALFTLLGVISVQSGLTYNLHLIKSEASLHAATIGGWLFPLLLPDLETSKGVTQLTLLMWLAIVVGLIAVPMMMRDRARPSRSRSWTRVVAAMVVAFAAASAAIGAATGARGRPEYTLNAGDARDRLIHFALTAQPAFAWSSTNGRVDVQTYFPNPEGTTASFSVEPKEPPAGAPIAFAVDVRRPGNRPGWGTALVAFGDGSLPVRLAIEGSGHAWHTYAESGDYEIAVEFQLWGLPPRLEGQRIHVTPR